MPNHPSKQLQKEAVTLTYIGNEPFLINDKPMSITMNDYWRWAYSDLADTRNRSVLAEFLVASSIGVAHLDNDISRSALKQYSLLSPDGYKLEIQSAAYIQSWDTEHPDHVSFQIAPSRLPSINGIPSLDTPLQRKSDVYVFCVYKAMEKDESPLNLDLWDFYVLPTSVLDEEKPFQKTITLPSLMKLEPIWCDYYGIPEAIQKVMKKGA